MKHLIFDTHNMIHRCRVASFGQNDGEFVLTFNFFLFLRPIVEKFNPEHVWFALEGHPKFRYDLYADYKSNRIEKYSADKSKYDEINRQKDIILENLKFLPVQTIVNPNVECDDTIGTLCNCLDGDKVVVSSDTDYIQLLQKYSNVKIYDPRKKEFMVAPEYHYVVAKALQGDKSDAIPKLISPKKAALIAASPEALSNYINACNEEQLNLFKRNRSLVEFSIDDNFSNCIIEKFSLNADALKCSWEEMKFASLLTEKAWNRYLDTFKNVISYN